MSQTLYVGHWDIKVSIMQAAYELSEKHNRVNRKPENRSQALRCAEQEALKRRLSPEWELGETRNASAERLPEFINEKTYIQQSKKF